MNIKISYKIYSSYLSHTLRESGVNSLRPKFQHYIENSLAFARDKVFLTLSMASAEYVHPTCTNLQKVLSHGHENSWCYDIDI